AFDLAANARWRKDWAARLQVPMAALRHADIPEIQENPRGTTGLRLLVRYRSRARHKMATLRHKVSTFRGWPPCASCAGCEGRGHFLDSANVSRTTGGLANLSFRLSSPPQDAERCRKVLASEKPTPCALRKGEGNQAAPTAPSQTAAVPPAARSSRRTNGSR